MFRLPARDLVCPLLMFAVGLVAIAGLTGCPHIDTPAESCEGDECIDVGDPVEECDQSSDCPVGEECVDNKCQPPPRCQINEDCPGEQVCQQGRCFNPAPPDTGQAEDGYEDTGTSDAEDGWGPDDTTIFPPDGSTDGGCMGCILENDAGPNPCVEGTDREACGSAGEQCSVCGEFEECKAGQCETKSCSPDICDGCCQDGECVDGTSATACGSGGEACNECQGDTRCTANQKCESCNGCWTANDECKSGETSSFCGTGGAACQSCGNDEKCESGQCIELSCSETCNGCCDGSSCRSGDLDSACGSDGASCRDCGQGYECDFRSQCDLDRDSRWDAIAIDGEVPKSDQNAVFFDSRGNPPDPYIKVKVGGISETKTGRSEKVSGDTTPFWHDATVTDVRAADLMGNNNVTFTLMDEDPWYAGSDDEIAKCKGDFDERHFENSVQFNCTNHPNASQPIEVKYKFKLEVH